MKIIDLSFPIDDALIETHQGFGQSLRWRMG